MSEDVEIEVRIGDRVFTVQFDNDTPYRGAALEDLEFLYDSMEGRALAAEERERNKA